MVLVTGASGFIGSQVCRMLAAQGLEVIALDRRFAGRPSPTALAGDLTDGDLLAALFHKHKFEAIVHLGGVLNTASRQRPEEAIRVNIGASLHLLRLAVEHRVSRFIFGSSISAYGPKPYSVHGPVSESEPSSPNNVYGICKRFVEVVGEDYRRQEGLEFAALRISMVVGPGAANTASPWRSEIFEGLLSAQPVSIHLPYTPGERLPLVHVGDVAAMLDRLVSGGTPQQGLYNTPSENWQCSDLADTLRSLNSNIEVTFGPSNSRGDPEAIDGSRFTEEFGLCPTSMEERLRGASGRL